jgi:putative ABC transport system ATP-binding protein
MSTYQKDDVLLRIADITYRYSLKSEEVPALSNIQFDIHEAELMSIVGQSGSGKSTLLSILGGLLKPTSGELLYRGMNIYKWNDSQLSTHRNQNIGFVFQNYFLDPMFSAIENVQLPLFVNRNLSEAELFLKAKSALVSVGLEHRLNHRPSEMSGGECQRVAIARAIVNDPEIIFADEPTGNLDSKNGALIIELLSQFTKANKTVVIVTHNLDQAKQCDRIIRLLDGRVVQ